MGNERIISVIKTMNQEELRDWYYITRACLIDQNTKAKSLFLKQFGEVQNLGDYYAVLRVAEESLPIDEANRLSNEAENEINHLLESNATLEMIDAIINKKKETALSALLQKRVNKGMSQAQLAKAAGINDVMVISRLERGETKMSETRLKTVLSIANALDIKDVRELL